MAANKSKNDVQLSAELDKVVSNLEKKAAKAGGVLTEDDIQAAVKDIDIDSEELSDLYDAVRAKGVDISSSGE